MGFKIKKKKTKYKAPAAYRSGAVSASGTTTGSRPPVKRRKGGAGPVILWSLLAVLVLAIAVTLFLSFREIGGKRGGEATDIVVTVPEGASTADIAAVLHDNGIIKNELLFKLYSRIKKADGTYQLGDHTVNSTLSYDEIIEVLQQITIKETEAYPAITFPEGTTALKMALMLEEAGICTRDEFISACNNDTYDVSFWNEISDNENKFIKVEGFLFPDTYEFELDVTPHDIVQQMLTNFEQKVLTPENQALIADSGLTLEENIILASIVEKESLGDNVYPQVAAVFHNRLNNPEVFPCLESDTSAERIPGNFIYGVLGYYYNGDTEPTLRNIPEAMWQGYDTYSKEGLIIGAICNPGLNAIVGTLEPVQFDYYFFITDNNKKFYWAETNAEHEQNIATVNRVNAAIEDGTFDPNTDYSAG